jgi:hypothetical protein
VYGKKNLVGIYKDGSLTATHDKFSKYNGDLERHIKQLQAEGYSIEEADGQFSQYNQILKELKEVVPDDVKKTAHEEDPAPDPVKHKRSTTRVKDDA